MMLLILAKHTSTAYQESIATSGKKTVFAFSDTFARRQSLRLLVSRIKGLTTNFTNSARLMRVSGLKVPSRYPFSTFWVRRYSMPSKYVLPAGTSVNGFCENVTSSAKTVLVRSSEPMMGRRKGRFIEGGGGGGEVL